MTKEALKLALEALEDLGMKHYESTGEVLYKDTFTAIKELLMSVPDRAQPEQEPVAWRAWVSKFPQGTGSDWVYVTKPIMKDRIHNQPLYTTPPQRTWVGLTPQERDEINEQVYGAVPHHVAFHAAIEAKLKEKNT